MESPATRYGTSAIFLDYKKSCDGDVYVRQCGRTFYCDISLILCARRNKAKEISKKLDELSVCGWKGKIVEGFGCHPACVNGRSDHRLLG